MKYWSVIYRPTYPLLMHGRTDIFEVWSSYLEYKQAFINWLMNWIYLTLKTGFKSKYDFFFILPSFRNHSYCTGCVICILMTFQMDVAKKWLMPGPWNFLKVFIILAFKLFDVELEKGQKSSPKSWAFDTLET